MWMLLLTTQCILLTGKKAASWTRTRKIASRPKGRSPLLALGGATRGGRPAGEAQNPPTKEPVSQSMDS